MLPAKSRIHLSVVAFGAIAVLSSTPAPGNARRVNPSRQTLTSPEVHPPFIPTPLLVARRMLQLARVGRNDLVYDLGSGDGRIVIMAAEEFGAHAVGVEIDEKLAGQSQGRIVELGLEERARIIRGDLFATNLTPATVVSLYLSTLINRKLRPVLEKELRHGARVVTEQCEVPGWEPLEIRGWDPLHDLSLCPTLSLPLPGEQRAGPSLDGGSKSLGFLQSEV